MNQWKSIALLAACSGITGIASAQVSVRIDGGNVQVNSGTSSIAVNQTGVIGPDVEMEGVAVINGQVYIDGVKIPKGTQTYRSVKSGKSYRIKWGKDGNVAVEEK